MSTGVRLAVVMDPIDHIKFEKDTTLAMLLAAQARGWSLHYLEQGDLRLRDGIAEGVSRPLSVRADPSDWFSLGEPAVAPLGASTRS
jgi:glutathione synthase